MLKPPLPLNSSLFPPSSSPSSNRAEHYCGFAGRGQGEGSSEGLIPPKPLVVPDSVCKLFTRLAEYDYRDGGDGTQGRPVDVEILGHIFEQSISDLERIHDNLAGRQTEGEPSKGRRKKEGAFYTPAFITRYIVEQTLGPVITERFAAHQARFQSEAAARVRKVFECPDEVSADLTQPQRKALESFWDTWLDELSKIRILDPACGSGAFLIEAFNQLHREYDRAIGVLSDLRGSASLFDPDQRILQQNLYGVDLNDEAIEIGRLSLWIKTAKHGQKLTSLDHTVRVGNSIVNDPAFDAKAFDWNAAFPEVMEAGGFDVVVGNPPYIRQEWIKQFKEHWENRFPNVFDSTADIYVYFYALAFSLLKPGGRLAFISSNSFARANYGRALRTWLVADNAIRQFVDLGDTQVFEDAKDVYPAIMVLEKQKAAQQIQTVRACQFRRNDDLSKLTETVEQRAWTVPVGNLTPDGWQTDDPEVTTLRRKLQTHGQKLDEFAKGRYFLGIKTALNEAFLVTDDKRKELIDESPKSSEVLKPCIGGEDARRWFCEKSGNWLVLFPNGMTRSACGAEEEKHGWEWVADTYPSIAQHLQAFEARARKRQDQGEFWWELRPCDYIGTFEKPKIVYPDIAKSTRFSMSPPGLYSTNTTYFLPCEDWFLLGVLNSNATWFSMAGISIPFGERAGEFRYRLFAQYMAQIPIPDGDTASKERIAELSRQCSQLAQRRYELETATQSRLTTSFGAGRPGKLNQKAQAWWEQGFTDMGAALKTSFKLGRNPFKNLTMADEWEPYLRDKKADHDALSRQLADAEAEINDRVFRLFLLTKDEIALLQREVEH